MEQALILSAAGQTVFAKTENRQAANIEGKALCSVVQAASELSDSQSVFLLVSAQCNLKTTVSFLLVSSQCKDRWSHCNIKTAVSQFSVRLSATKRPQSVSFLLVSAQCKDRGQSVFRWSHCNIKTAVSQFSVGLSAT